MAHLAPNYDTKTFDVTTASGTVIKYRRLADAYAAHPEVRPAPLGAKEERELVKAERRSRAGLPRSRGLGGRFA